MYENPDDSVLKEILTKKRIVAVVGVSDNSERDSYRVAGYLQKHGYRVIPVNPNINGELLGEKVYPDLSSVPGPIDIVDIFRRSEEVPSLVETAISLKPAVIWLQLGVINEKVSAMIDKREIVLVMDRCIKKEHSRLFSDSNSI